MANRYFLERIATRDADIRAGDADRERTAERLRHAHAEGRLDLDEFQQRLDRCYESKTFGELDSLVRDLPRQPAGENRPHRSWRLGFAVFALALIALSLVSAAAAHHHVFLVWIPALFLLWRVSWWRRRRWWSGPWRGWDA